jgi:hypothetical protein
MQIECDGRNLKHDSSVCVNLDLGSNVTDPTLFGLCQTPLKCDLHRISTELGMQIDCNQQNSKHDSSICFNLDSDSNEIDFSFESSKYDLQRLSTELGMQINCKKHHLKHDSSIRFNLDPDSKVIDPISFRFLWPPLKQELERISTDLGMQINCKKYHLKHDFFNSFQS